MNMEQPIRPYSRPEGSPLRSSSVIDETSGAHGCRSKAYGPPVRLIGGNEYNSSSSGSKSSSSTFCSQKISKTKNVNYKRQQEQYIISTRREEEKCSLPDIEPMTDVYRFARQNEWDQVAEQCRFYSDETRYVNPIDGTTALHLAIMSRTGYTLEDGYGVEPVIPTPAPLSVIEELLQIFPYAAMIPCLMNSYTPLAYACLVSGDECNLDDAAAMVRLLSYYAPDCVRMFTSGGLSALDVHIISYSHRQEDDKEETLLLSGRSSTVVLRTLLEAEPALALPRRHCDKIGGPIELLYRCNSAAFTEVLNEAEDICNANPDDENDKTVINAIGDWWVWKWTILILKYGTLRNKRAGAAFLAVQAATKMVGCPGVVLKLAMKAFTTQSRLPDVMHNFICNFPLHQVCTWPCEVESSIFSSSDSVIASRKSAAIGALLQEYPHASRIPNALHQTPLELAVSSGTMWDGGVRKLVKSNPMAVSYPSPTTGLYPFMTAAAVACVPAEIYQQRSPIETTKRGLVSKLKRLAKRELDTLRTVYGLLRSDPTVLINRFQNFEEEEEEEEEYEDEELYYSENVEQQYYEQVDELPAQFENKIQLCSHNDEEQQTEEHPQLDAKMTNLMALSRTKNLDTRTTGMRNLFAFTPPDQTEVLNKTA
eukprot:CAMPEP_0195283520 /NCGR_PEP_ID=MMETSP0707-20130614/2042_1 /TAXON_ID=33640 /ORGANISM="Asterionellopsis glacialis, Strain CCMP134" /LENGTH=651 /DNA_ID=CAMNT_0040342703 /DNA_START=134 /DNA_END=2089 /DNA_ORIENTATION=+